MYDPMGFLSPLTVKMKILFQEPCIEKTNWDIELKEESLRKWKSLLQDLILIDCYRIPRCYFAPQPVDTAISIYVVGSKLQVHATSTKQLQPHPLETPIFLSSKWLAIGDIRCIDEVLLILLTVLH